MFCVLDSIYVANQIESIQLRLGRSDFKFKNSLSIVIFEILINITFNYIIYQTKVLVIRSKLCLNNLFQFVFKIQRIQYQSSL